MESWVRAALAPFGGADAAGIDTPDALAAEIARRLRTRIVEDRRRGWEGMLGKTAIYPHPSGLSFWLLLGDSMATGIIRADRDDAATRFVLARLTPGGTFLDIGANAGWFALRAGQRYHGLGGGQVHAFEPQARLHALLERSIALNGLTGVQAHHLALGDHAGEIFMSDGGLNSGGSFVRLRGKAGAASTPMRPLDEVTLDAGRIDIVKIDIEGSEPMFFRGAEAFVRRYRPTFYSELHPRKLQQVAGIGREDYLDQVEALGYRTLMLDREGVPAAFDRAVLRGNDRLLNVVFEPVERSPA